MKTLRRYRQSVAVLLTILLATWQVVPVTHAATVTWNASSGTNFSWVDILNWDLGAAPLAGDDAIFSRPVPNPGALANPSVIVLGAGSVANRLVFNDNYTLTGGTLASGAIQADLATSITIASQLTGTLGLAISGGGSIRLTNLANDYTGVTAINTGSLIITNPAQLGADPSAIRITAGNSTPSNTSLIGFSGGSLVLDGTAGGFDLARNIDFEGRGPLGDRGAAILSLGNNTLSGTLSSAVSTQTPATFRNSRVNSVNGQLNLPGTVNVGGTSATTFLSFGGVNAAGVGDYSLTGVIQGTGSIEKSGAGTLFLNPSSTAGFGGTVRVSGSATGQQSSVMVTQASVGTTSIFGTNTVAGDDPSAIDMNGGVLEFRNDASMDFSPLAGGKNVYLRANSTFFTGPAAGGAGINGVTTLGTFRVAANTTGTFNSRNGYGVSLGAWTQESSNNANTITNNMGGTLLFTGDAWNNNDGSARTLAVGGGGNTRIAGSITASGTNKALTKTGAGELAINGVASTLTGTVAVQGGAVRITDFRSIANNTAAISLGNATTTAGHLIIGGTGVGTGTAAGLTTSKPITLNTTTVSPSIYANQSGANPVILNGAITRTAQTTGGLILGGTNAADNIINAAIPAAGTSGGVTKLGSGTWVLGGVSHLYPGATTIQNGTLKLRATASASDVVGSATGNTVVFSANTTTGTAGGTLEFGGFSGVATTETLGALTPTAGAATVRLLGNGGAANLTFTSLGATTAASSLNFDTTGASGGLIALTGQAATTATNLPGTANLQGHLYVNGADFAVINGTAQVTAPTYAGAGNFQNAAGALVSAVHNKLTGSFTSAAATVSSLVTNNQTLTLSGNLTVSTGAILQSGGTATIQSDSPASQLILGGAAATNIAIRVNGDSDVLNLGTAVAPVNIGSAQTGGLTKNGAGKLVVFGTNAQTGTTNINEGIIELNGAGARLAAAGGVNTTIRQNASLDFNTAFAFVENPAVGTLDGAGTVRNTGSADVTFVQTGAGTWAGGFNETGAGKLHVSKLGTTGAPTWSGTSNYTGVTTIGGTTGLVTVNTLANGGVVSGIGASTSAAANLVFAGSTAGLVYQGSILDGALTLGSKSASTDRLFTLAGTGATLSSTVSNNNGIIWSNTGAIAHGIVGPQALIFTGTSTGDNTFNPQLTDSGTGTDITSVTKQGAGQWNLGNSNNTYTGATTINEGILGLNHNGAIHANSPVVFTPTSATSVAVLQMSGTFDRSLSATPTAGTGSITWNGATASTTGGAGFAAHASPLIVAIGGIGAPTALTWGSGGFVGTSIAQNLVLNSSTALSSVDFRNAIDLGASVRTINVLDNGNTGADYATMSGVLSGTGGGLLKIGTGVLRLTAANTYTGTTSVEAGTLVVSSFGSSTDAPNTATGVGVSGVTMDNANAIILGNATTTGGILQYVGSGETSDRKIRLRGTTAGNQIHADGSGPLILTNVAHDTTETGNKTLSLRGSNTAGNMITSQLTDNVAGVLSVTVDGGATWILTNSTNSYTGNTTASSGALGIGDDAALSTGTLVNSNGNVFAHGGDRTLTNPVTLANNATNGWIGDHSITFVAAANLAAGANNVNTYNSIAAGKALTFSGGITANALTANRAWTLDGAGETVINGDFTTTSPYGVAITKNGNGTLVLGTTGATSNWNRNAAGIDVDRGTLRFTASDALSVGTFTTSSAPTTAGTAIAATTFTVASTAGLVPGQNFSGTNVIAGSTIVSIDSPTTFTASAAPTTAVANNTTLTFAAYGGLTLSPELATGDTALVDLNGTVQTFNSLTATTDGAVVIDNTSSSPSTLTIGANNNVVSISNAGARTITDSGAGALSIVKTGSTALSLPTGMTLTYQGTTTSNGGGSLTINSPVNGTTGLAATGGSTLSLPGGLTTPSVITSVAVGGGSTLGLIDGAGSQITNLTSLSLGNSGMGTVTLNLNVGDGLTPGDNANTDLLRLLTGGTLSLGNTITFNLTDAGLNAGQTYTLLNVVDGGLTAFGLGNLIQGATPGGYTSYSWNTTDTSVSLTVGSLITGNLFWRGLAGGGTDSTWNANANNWSLDKANTSVGTSIPGAGTDVIFAIDSAAGAVDTTLEGNFKINSLTFEAGVSTPSSVSIAPGAVNTNRLEIAPQTATKGIAITAGGPSSVTISAPVRLGAAQTWNVADPASVLTFSGGLQNEADVTKTGGGKVTLSTAADNAFNTGLTSDFIVNGGTLETLNADALGVVGKRANVAINTSGVFYYNNATAGTVANPLSLGGGTLSAGGNGQTYSGTVNVSGNSIINMADANGPATNTARNITLSGVVSGSGSLTIDSNNTVTTGNQFGGTLTLNNAGTTWTGDLLFNRGTVTMTSAVSPSFTTNNLTFNSFGRLNLQGVNSQTLTNTGTLTYAANAIGEIGVDNTSGTVSAPFTLDMTGPVSLGANAGLRLLLSDGANSVANFPNGVTLGGSASISVGGGVGGVASFSGVISDGGGAFGLAVNDDLGGWATTNRTVRLTGLNTFTGNVTLGEGVLEFDTVTNAGGAASSLGQGAALTTGAATLSFIGGVSQATNRPITQTGATTLAANGTAGATITYSGAIAGGASSLNLDGAGTGILGGVLTQTAGGTNDLNKNGTGTWTLTATNSIADDLNVNAGILNINAVQAVFDDIVVSNAGTIVNINVANAHQGDDLFIRNGAVVNLGITGALGAGMDALNIAENATAAATATLDLKGFNSTVGAVTIGFENSAVGQIVDSVGGGVLTAASYTVRQGLTSANLAGAGGITKNGRGVFTVSGVHTFTGASTVTEGQLILDYTTNNTSKIASGAGLTLGGVAGDMNAILTFNGNAATASTQNFTTLTVNNGASDFVPVSNGGQAMNVSFTTITRTAAGGTVDFTLPAVGNITSTQALTNGILGGYATIGSGAAFATKDGSNNLIPLVATPKDDVTTWLTADNVTDATGFTGVLTANCPLVNSITFTQPSSTITVGTRLAVSSGGILVTSGATGAGISGGQLHAGTPDLIIHQHAAGDFTISSAITSGTVVTKTGNGALVLSGQNTSTGGIHITEGVVKVSGGNAIGDSAPVNFKEVAGSGLTLLSNETVGNLVGGTNANTIALGNNALTTNTSSNQTFSGLFTGSGSLVKQGTANLNLDTSSSTGFTGSVVINQGLLQLSGNGIVNLPVVSSITSNQGGSLLIDFNSGTTGSSRISDAAVVNLSSLGNGSFFGVHIRSNQDVSHSETIGAINLVGGASVIGVSQAGGTGRTLTLTTAALNRQNNATVFLNGRNFAVTSGDNRGRLLITAAPALVGGTGATGATNTNVPVIRHAVTLQNPNAIAAGDVPNTFASYNTTTGVTPLSITNEYRLDSAGYTASADANDNLRFTMDAAALATKTFNAVVFDSSAASMSIAGAGGGTNVLTVNSGAMLFTSTASANGTTVSGFDSITPGAGSGNEFIITVANNTSTINSVLADGAGATTLTKSGTGTLVLGAANTYTGPTYFNQGVVNALSINSLGNGGELNFFGGTLQFGGVFDPSVRTMNFSALSGATFDTNGIDITFANPVGNASAGTLTKTGLGSLTLGAVVTYTGQTIVQNGNLVLGVAGALPATHSVTVSGGNLDLGASPVTLNTVTLNSGGIIGTTSLTASSLVLSGGSIASTVTIAGTAGITKTGNGTVTVGGANTFTGQVVVQDGVLAFDSIANADGTLSALGAPANAAQGAIRLGYGTTTGTLSYTGGGHSTDRQIHLVGSTGGGMIDADGTGALVLNGAITSEDGGAKSLTLRGSSGAGIVNRITSPIAECNGVLTLAKLDGNIWQLDAASTYTGATQVDNGTLRLGVANALPATTATRLGSTTTAGVLDLNGFDQTIGSLVVQTNSNAVTNQILINTGNTLTINGGVTIGVNASATAVTQLTASGGGSLVVNSGGANFQVGGATGGTNSNAVTADFSALNAFTANLGAGTFRMGDANTGTSADPSSLKLAVNNTITAASIRIGDGSGPSSTHTLTLGSGTNVFNADTVNVGSAGTTIRSSGAVVFDGADTTGTLQVRAANGTSRATINMVNTTGNTAGDISSTINLNGHTADVMASTLTMAARSTGTGAATATLSFDQGALDVTTLTMASRTGTGTGNATATLNLGDSAAPGSPTTTIGTVNMAVNTSAGGTVTSNLVITGGTVNIGTGSGTAINMANAAAGRTAVSNINLTGGTLSVTGDIVRTGGAGTETATITVNGGSLNLNGKSIGTAGAPITLQAQSGTNTISGLAELNGGGLLTKSTTGVLSMGDGNTYTGGTLVSDGTLLATNTTGSATGSGAVTVAAAGTLGGTGSIIAGSNNNITIDGILNAGMPTSTTGTALALTVGGTGQLQFNGTTVFDLFANTGGVNLPTSNDRVVVNAPAGSNIIFGTSSILQISTTLAPTAYANGDTWQLFDWSGVAGGVTGGFASINLPVIDSAFMWDTANLYSLGVVSVIAVPEPSRALLMLLGLLGLMMRRRRN
ncbi:MAG: autotransporter-associated beta strand repeat-containing protein [Verrucomicrobiaceae bacterium]|nr:autotransporter-associated beta strand repeat-containing protein [Verrucomicrobiaceae bacterium]